MSLEMCKRNNARTLAAPTLLHAGNAVSRADAEWLERLI